MRSTGPTSVGHSRRTSRSPSSSASGPLGEHLLEVALDAVLLEPGVLAELVLELGQDLGEPDLEPVLAAARPLPHDDRPVALLDHGRRRHPVQRLVPAAVRVDEDGAVRLEDEQPDRLRQVGVQAAGVRDLAAGDDETHGPRTVAPTADERRRQRSQESTRSLRPRQRAPSGVCPPKAGIEPRDSAPAESRWRASSEQLDARRADDDARCRRRGGRGACPCRRSRAR